MSGAPPLPWAVRAILALAGRLVPAGRRHTWRSQWLGDLEHARRAGGRPSSVALGAFAHAFYLRREEGMMRGFLGDVRQSVRSLARRPGFSVLTVLTLAVGIGTATAMYSLAEVMLFRTLPIPGSEGLVRIHATLPARGWTQSSVSYPDFVDYSARTDLFTSASFYADAERDLSGVGDPQRLLVARVHRGFFETVGATTVIGRSLDDGDQRPGADPTVVLSEALWRSRFGGGSDVLGATVRLDGVPHTVVGVVRSGHEVPVMSQAWIPLQFGDVPPAWADDRSNHSWQAIARLAPGVGVESASEQLRTMARAQYVDARDERDRGMEAEVSPLRAGKVNSAEQNIFLLMGMAVSFVLLIASLNASGLIMTHLSARSRELSLRTALGAGRGRIVGQLLMESVTLAAAAGVVGTVMAVVGVRGLVRFGPPEMATLLDVQVNGAVLAGAVGISLLASLLAGLAPAMRASKASPAEAMKEGSAQVGTGRSSQRLRNGLVIAEVAVSVMLLTGAGLTIRSFQAQFNADPGFEPEGIVSFTTRIPATRYADDAQVRGFFAETVRRLESVPGVGAASAASLLPLGVSSMNLNRAFVFEGASPPPQGVEYSARWVEIDENYLPVLGVGPDRGRAITRDDRDGTEPVVLINQAMASRLDDGSELLGRRIRAHHDEQLPRTIVGIVPDLQLDGIRGPPQPAVFVPASQSPSRSMVVFVRTSMDLAAILPGIRGAMSGLDRDVALEGIRTLSDSHRMGLGGIRFIMSLFGAFGFMALVIAVSGIYGQVAYSVSQRTREIGIRMAVGATAAGVQGSIVREGARLAGIGIVVGSGMALGFAKLMSSALFGLSWLDAPTFLTVIGTLAASALVASWVPARRASNIDPLAALKAE
jgi:predicted permease